MSLLALSFPKFGHPAVAWIALAPILIALAHPVSLRRAFGLGLTTGLIYLGGSLYWLTGVMARYGGLKSPVAVLINIAFVAYLALYPALFAVIMRRLWIAFGATALVAVPFVWTATELGRMYIFTGFPWVLLGYSQATVLPDCASRQRGRRLRRVRARGQRQRRRSPLIKSSRAHSGRRRWFWWEFC